MGNSTLRNVSDSYVAENTPTKNFYNLTRLVLDNTGSAKKYGYMFWANPFPIGATIISAKLRLYNAGAWSGAETLTVQRAASKFAHNKITWNNKPGVTGTSASSGPVTGAADGTMWEFDIKSIMDSVAAGGVWYGLRLINSSGNLRKLYSAQAGKLRPEVIITWSDNPDAPSTLSPANNLAVPGQYPRFACDFTDVSGDVQMQAMQVQIDDVSDFLTTLWDSGTVFTSVPELVTDPADPTRIAGDLMINGNAENIAGYQASTNCAVALDATVFRGGTNSVKMTATGAGNMAAVGAYTAGNRRAVTPGDLVIVNGFAYAQATARSTTIGIAFMDNTGTPFGSVTYSTASNDTVGAWKQYSVQVVAPAGAAYAYVVYTHAAAAAAEIHRWDDTTMDIQWQGIAGGTSRWWRCRVQDGAGLWSDWSDPAQFKRVALPTLTITYPAASPNNYVSDPSAVIAWTFTGQVQYQVMIQDKTSGNKVVYDSGKLDGSAQSLALPAKTLKNVNNTYTVTILCWDVETRTAPGYVKATRDFVFTPQGATSPPSALTLTTNTTVDGWVDIAFTSAAGADWFLISRNDGVTETFLTDPTGSHHLLPADWLVSGTSYKFTDKAAPPRTNCTYKVYRVISGIASATPPSASILVKASTCILSERDGSGYVFLYNPAHSIAATDDSQVFYPVGDSAGVQISQGTHGAQGTTQGRFSDQTGKTPTAKASYGILDDWANRLGTIMRLTIADQNYEVVIRNVVQVPVPYPDGTTEYDVSFDWFEAVL